MKILLSLVVIAAMAVSMRAYASTGASTFAQKVAIAVMFEIKTSELALQKTKNETIRVFADKMIADHTKADKEMKDAVSISSIRSESLPTFLDSEHQAIYDNLAKLTGDEFDRAYIKAQLEAHKDAVSLFTSYASNGDEDVLVEFAQKTLPTLEGHLQHIQKLSDSATQ